MEWLTRGPANKLGRAFGRVGSNPAGDDFFGLFLLNSINFDFPFLFDSLVLLLCTYTECHLDYCIYPFSAYSTNTSDFTHIRSSFIAIDDFEMGQKC